MNDKNVNDENTPPDENPIDKFVENLKEIDSLPDEAEKPKNPLRDFLKQLIEAYGLPEDAYTEELFLQLRRRLMSEVFVPGKLLHYIRAYLHNFRSSGRDINTVLDAAFLFGVALGEYLKDEELTEEMEQDNIIEESMGPDPRFPYGGGNGDDDSPMVAY